MAMHIKLNHPSTHQLKSVISRNFYALDLDTSCSRLSESCHQCSALKTVPRTVVEQSTSDPPEAVGVSFAADILRRERQFIIVLRETVTSYTRALIVDSEKRECLREALIMSCSELQPLEGPYAVIRTDAAPAFVSLVADSLLEKHRLSIEIG